MHGALRGQCPSKVLPIYVAVTAWNFIQCINDVQSLLNSSFIATSYKRMYDNRVVGCIMEWHISLYIP